MTVSSKKFRNSLVFKLIVMVAIPLILSIGTWAFFNVRYQKKALMTHFAADADRLSNTIFLLFRSAMISNTNSDIRRILQDISQQKELSGVRIYNKSGEIKYSSQGSEIKRKTSMQSASCKVCHLADPPRDTVSLMERILVTGPEREPRLSIVSPIWNETGCVSASCHAHPSGQKMLGTMQVTLTLQEIEKALFLNGKGIVLLAVIVALITSAVIFTFIIKFINQPIKKMISGTRRIAEGKYFGQIGIDRKDELGQLANAIDHMGREIGEQQAELNRQRNDYQNLFEQVPCLITVQDRNFRLIGFNNEFSEKFNPRLGDHCYRAYKARDRKCNVCPVEMTFADGESHIGEERGKNKDGSTTYWVVKTSPIKDKDGNIVAAMEMSLDITHSRQLEQKLEASEKKYQEIFSNMPNPAFVLDQDNLTILDCNQRIKTVYGYERDEILGTSFIDLFEDRKTELSQLMTQPTPVINRVKHETRSGDTIYVDIWVSPLEYMGEKVLLVTTSDITKRLEAEQQLIQAGKMTTLGEMATGVAHELNQPLSVIKTASSFCMKKVHLGQKIDTGVLFTMLEKIDNNVDRATRIIRHMREFARKTDLKLVRVQMNSVVESAFEIFSQQLRLRGIDVVREFEQGLPVIKADPDRLEQVMINLLINARDAIEDRWGPQEQLEGAKKIILRTWSQENLICVEICDTGSGIPENLADKIFEPFFTTKEVGKGTGLGLSISYGIIKDCKGSIKLQSTSPEGSCFRMTFPQEMDIHQ